MSLEETREREKRAKGWVEREKDRSSLFLLRRTGERDSRHEFRTESVRQRRQLEVAGLSLSLAESGARYRRGRSQVDLREGVAVR